MDRWYLESSFKQHPSKVLVWLLYILHLWSYGSGASFGGLVLSWEPSWSGRNLRRFGLDTESMKVMWECVLESRRGPRFLLLSLSALWLPLTQHLCSTTPLPVIKFCWATAHRYDAKWPQAELEAKWFNLSCFYVCDFSGDAVVNRIGGQAKVEKASNPGSWTKLTFHFFSL